MPPLHAQASPAAASGSRLATPSIGAALAAAQAALERLNANAAARAIALQFPTPSPGVGVQFPTPGMPLSRLQVRSALMSTLGLTICRRVLTCTHRPSSAHVVLALMLLQDRQLVCL